MLTPSQLSNLAAWWRSDLSITTISGNVSEWDDQKSAIAATQSIAGDRPSYTSSGGLKNLPFLTFAAANPSALGIASNILSSGTDRSVYVVGKCTSAAGGTLFQFKTGNPQAAMLYFNAASTNFIFSDGASNSTIAGTSLPATNVGQIYHWDYHVGSKVVLELSGVAQTVTGANEVSDTGATGTTIGFRQGTGQGWTGDIYEVIITNGILSASDNAKVTAYLKARYGIT
jgi:hypothetical protein